MEFNTPVAHYRILCQIYDGLMNMYLRIYGNTSFIVFRLIETCLFLFILTYLTFCYLLAGLMYLGILLILINIIFIAEAFIPQWKPTYYLPWEEKFGILKRNQDLIYDENRCPICLVNYTKNTMVSLLRCNHYFHQNCLNQWLKQSYQSRCPICQGSIYRLKFST